ncbi:hypothetical protein DDV21_001725 [Streptococcus chenjunshii]|uniref:Uncharacterized protein n=1 Tax=Streptococcus chenjunshii TaxID=2173853 RepID=A0A372KJF2_9STRE|nr:hypothetical protein DDV21_001725 [Streptococcus chenjunshii]RFU50216.1 hypothetical protein DDV22_09920 [Streptococcus chenjunshii]RFU52395.1 hypothetical protein DDV23_10015 [Streptococcus chenjunshii]
MKALSPNSRPQLSSRLGRGASAKSKISDLPSFLLCVLNGLCILLLEGAAAWNNRLLMLK